MERLKRKKEAPAYKRLLNLILKLGITCLALYLVLRKVDIAHIKDILRHTDYLWLIPAWLLFIASKVISAFRLQAFFQCIKLPIATYYNLKLYFVGMFYNLFLPGGIGGDGYKIFILRKQYPLPVKDLFSAILLDRISGVGALGILALLTLLQSAALQQLEAYRGFVWLSLLISFPLYYLFFRLFFYKFMPAFVKTTLLAFVVQLLQAFSAMAILHALHSLHDVADYIALFLLSSIAAMLPLTIGGVGAREAVFVLLPQWIHAPVNQNTAVTMSLIFFLITAISSLIGAFVNLHHTKLTASSSTHVISLTFMFNFQIAVINLTTQESLQSAQNSYTTLCTAAHLLT